MSSIHPSAVVHPNARISEGVTIEPFAVVGPHVSLETGVVIKSHAVIEGCTTIGQQTIIYPHAVIGTAPQDLKYRGEETRITIGQRCQIREFVTINSSTQEGSLVSVGDDCMLMAYSHVAHNCSLGNRVIMANGATLAGHCLVEDGAIIGGMTPVHQWSRIGRFSMVGGMSRIGHDMPPYMIGGGIPFKMGGLNLVGLKRRGIPKETRFELTRAFRILYRSGLRLNEALDRIEAECASLPEIIHLVSFCRASRRGLVCMQGVTRAPATVSQEEALSLV
jgi:UDP-N-acetylglucosamine acyltransferase